jgi:hypothetical protein
MPDSRAALFQRAQQAEQKGNRAVRDLWERYAGHRQHLTAALLALARPAGGRLCLLGAGNANDLDLEALAAGFEELHLVDLDPGALSRATGRQSPATRARLRSHAPVDLSGLYLQLGRGKAPGLDALVDGGAVEVLRQLPGDFDVVASCCVLSQMSWALSNLAESGGVPLPLLEQALLRIHLRTLLGLVRPGGTALLAADLVSSNTYPLEELEPTADLRTLANELASQRLAYAVCNPELIRQVMRRDPALAGTSESPAMGDPWLWAGPKELTYLVCPLLFHRRP